MPAKWLPKPSAITWRHLQKRPANPPEDAHPRASVIAEVLEVAIEDR